jgi:hypothetical protein
MVLPTVKSKKTVFQKDENGRVSNGAFMKE